MWVLLAQKAMAKRLGSYTAAIGGRAVNAMRLLTGAPAYYYRL